MKIEINNVHDSFFKAAKIVSSSINSTLYCKQNDWKLILEPAVKLGGIQ